jgi:hypothetical protein
MRKDVWTDSHHESNTRFPEMCEVPEIVHFVINLNDLKGTDLRSLDPGGQSLSMAQRS